MASYPTFHPKSWVFADVKVIVQAPKLDIASGETTGRAYTEWHVVCVPRKVAVERGWKILEQEDEVQPNGTQTSGKLPVARHRGRRQKK